MSDTEQSGSSASKDQKGNGAPLTEEELAKKNQAPAKK